MSIALGITQAAAGEPSAVSPAQTVTSADGVLTVTVPAGALGSPARIRVQSAGRAGVPRSVRSRALGGAYRLLPNGIRFAKPVRITWRVPGTHTLERGVPVGYLLLSSGGKIAKVAGVKASLTGGKLVVTGTTRHFSNVFLFKGRAEATFQPGSVGKSIGDDIALTLRLTRNAADFFIGQPRFEHPSFLGAPRVAGNGRPSWTGSFNCREQGEGQVGVKAWVYDRSLRPVGPIASEVSLSSAVHCGSRLFIYPIKAVFDQAQRLTRYTVEVYVAEQSVPLTYSWKLTPPAQDPGCNNMGRPTSTAAEFVWVHGDEHGCNHLIQGPNGHLGVVDVAVINGIYSCFAEYHGSNTGIGGDVRCSRN